MKSSQSGARALTFPAAVASLALLFTACGQSPGETGLGYLEAQGIRISAPLYHLTLEDLPLDSVFASEVPLNHYGESLLVVGREGDYITRARLGFQISTKAQRDSLVGGLHLRLSAIQTSGQFAGRDYIRDAASGRDSVRLLVESFSWVDSTGSYSDSLTLFHRRILTTPVPFSTLDGRFKRRDTITVYPKRAYPDSGIAQDSSQAGFLPNLWSRLRNEAGSDTARKWAVFLEISPLTTVDSGMFHFSILNVGGNDLIRRRYLSGLWLGRYAGDSLTSVGSMVGPYVSSATGFYRPASNYDARYTGTSTRSLLHGISRGVHLRINRDTLLNRIRLRLNAHTPGDSTLGNRLLGSNPSGTFDRRFFVPYAEMRLPVDPALTRVPGSFAFDLGVTTDVDSIGDGTASFRDDIGIATGDSLRLVVHGGTSGTSSAVDTLIVSYRPHPVDTTLRQVLTRWANATVADTVSLTPDGLHRELTLRRHTGWARATTLSVKPAAARLGVEVYFNVTAVTEPRFILDSLGNEISTKSRLVRRFYRPGADSVNVRVTRGLRNLLNRVPGSSIAPDMFLRTVDRDAFDTSLVSNLTYRRVVQPAFGEIDFKRAGDGRLKVGIDLYLYPLEAGQ
jgi:hypothetical protein